MDTNSPVVNYPTPPTTSHNFSSLSFNINKDSGNYPYTYSPNNSCVSETDNNSPVSSTIDPKENTSPKMNMNNYNNINLNINMYNATSIISSNNNNVNLNTSPNNTSNYGQEVFQAYPNSNNTNINPSIQQLSPKEMSNQHISQQNYINYSTSANPNQVNNDSVNNMMSNNNMMNVNNQKLTIDTNNDTQSSGNSDETVDVKTPTSVKSENDKKMIKNNSIQMNTPPMTPLPEKNKKRRGDHIHYNIKTNMFTETKQYYEVFNYDKTKSFNFRIIPKVDRGFFPTGPERDFTCYRRNYFQISVSFSADNVKNPIEFNNPCYLKIGNEYSVVKNFYIGVSAKVKNSNKEIVVVQQTAKREKGPQEKPAHKLCRPGGNPNFYHGATSNKSIITFERLQFKSATPNSSKRVATQQFYALVIELYAETSEKKYKIATLESKRLIVRGRSPGHYKSNGFDDPILLSKSPEPSSYGYYENNGNNDYNNSNPSNNNNNNNGNYGYGSNQGNYPVFNNTSSANQIPCNYNNDYSYNQNINLYNPNQGQFAPVNSMDQSNGQSSGPYTFSYNGANGSNNSSPYTKPNSNNGMNYQNNFYPMKSMEDMYQTPPLPPQQSPQSISTTGTYSPYVQGQVQGLFQSQPQASTTYPPSDNYYAQNQNSSTSPQQPFTQNVNSSNQVYNQDIIFASPTTQFQTQTPSPTNTNQSTNTSSMNPNYTVANWNNNGAF